MPFPYEDAQVEKRQSPVSPFRGQKNRGAGQPAWSFEKAHVGGDSGGSWRRSGSRGVRRPVRPPREWAQKGLQRAPANPRDRRSGSHGEMSGAWKGPAFLRRMDFGGTSVPSGL